MRAWYQMNDPTGFPGESYHPESSSLRETVARILAETEL